MTFEHLRRNNVERCETFLHPVFSWLPSQWSNAMAGECGETCNVTKKMDRLTDPAMLGQMNKDGDLVLNDLVEKAKEEIADVVIYADLLAHRLGFNLDDAIRSKFNRTSHEHELRNGIAHLTLPRL